jgi:hypothetical protein
LPGFVKAVLAVLGIGVATAIVVFGIVPYVKQTVADQGLDDRGVRIVGVVDSVDPPGSVKFEQLRYHYTVDGTTYRDSADATGFDEVGREIKLVYDPENPGNSRVDLSRPAAARSSQGWGGPWVYALGALAVVAVAVVWFRRRR